jgi:hypothetical protein
MSQEFNALRARARNLRDKAIADARSEYEYQLTQIAKLEQDLLGKVSSRYRKISAAIESVIPSDRTFTTVDIMTALEALDPRRAWRKRSIDNHLSRLRQRGLVRRVKRASIHEPAVYARAEAPVKPVPFEDMTLIEVVGKALTKPMTTTEICVAILEAGYQTEMSRNNLRNHVTRLLSRNGYKSEDGKWLS